MTSPLTLKTSNFSPLFFFIFFHRLAIGLVGSVETIKAESRLFHVVCVQVTTSVLLTQKNQALYGFQPFSQSVSTLQLIKKGRVYQGERKTKLGMMISSSPDSMSIFFSWDNTHSVFLISWAFIVKFALLQKCRLAFSFCLTFIWVIQ